MKYFFLFYLVPSLTLADIVIDCGVYTVKGIVRGGEGISIIVNEKTQSQYTITMPVTQQAQIGSYLDSEVTAQINLSKKLTPIKGETKNIMSIERRIPNPLNPEDTGMKLYKKSDCQKV
ncbi:MAG: hypothetical protein H7336_07960 [Bacteriovorax sp.]|nr:hypothetical protein [Bacteriovorax sp.]